MDSGGVVWGMGVWGGTDLVQIVVLSNKLLQLGLDVHNLRDGELELNNRNTRLLEVLQEANL